MLLYLLDKMIDPEVTVKVMGSQWFWSYSVYGYGQGHQGDSSSSSDSFISNDLETGELRQLAVDNYLVLPINTSIRLVASKDAVVLALLVTIEIVFLLGCPKKNITAKITSK